ncbi:hypothetical protein FOZ63_032839, partial [Perkinsus olseni]
MRSNFEGDERPKKIRKTVKWRPGARRPGDDSLESCLSNRGLLWLEDVAFEKAPGLPLEIFDDTSFWMRTPHEWNEFIRTMGGRPLAGRYLSKEEGKIGVLRDCYVYSFDETTGKANVSWKDSARTSSDEQQALSPIFLCIHGENPSLFADRLKAAVTRRRLTLALCGRYAESQIRLRMLIEEDSLAGTSPQ